MRQGRTPLAAGEDSRRNWRRINALGDDGADYERRLVQLEDGDHRRQIRNSWSLAQEFHLKSIQADYITCRTWDGSTEGDTDIYIARPADTRNSIASETKAGETFTYDYTSPTTGYDYVERKSDNGTIVETQRIVPYYVVDGIITAIPAQTSVSVGDVPVTWLEVSARAWALEET